MPPDARSVKSMMKFTKTIVDTKFLLPLISGRHLKDMTLIFHFSNLLYYEGKFFDLQFANTKRRCYITSLSKQEKNAFTV